MGTNDEGPSRRDALKVGAMVATATGLSAVLGAIPRASRASGTGHATVKYGLADPAAIVAGSCAGCTGGCPIRTVRADGIVAKVDGNPYSPRQGGDPMPDSAAHAARLRGASCARGQSRVNVVHDPWRLIRPLVRVGERGSMAFRTATAEEWSAAALPAVLDAHRASLGSPAGAPPRVVVAVDPRHGDRRVVLAALERLVAGSRAVLGHPAPRLAAASAEVVGAGWLAAPRWERATLRVAWGADPVASGLDPVGSARGLAGRRTELVAIDPRLSSTAGLAGRWLPVRPGADGDLASWVAARWVARGLLPADQVPAQVLTRPDSEHERRTGLGRDLVDGLAERMAAAGPGLAVALGGGLSHAAAVTILRLCAHVGAMGPGGAMAPAADPIPAVDGPRALRDLVLGEQPPDVLIVVGGAGVQDTGYEREILAALADPQRVRQVIVVQTAPGPFLAVADAVLPDVTELERLGLAARHDGTAVALPVIAPVPSAWIDGPLGRGLEGLFDAIAAGLGSDARSEGVVAEAVNAAAIGEAPPSPEDDLALTASLGPTPWATPAARTLLLRGWWPPTPGDPPPVAPAPLPEAEPAPPSTDPALIGWTEPFGGTADADAQVWGGRSVRQTNRAEVHPETVAGLGEPTGYLRLTGGDRAVVVEARVTEEVRPGVVALARGYGQKVGYQGDWGVDGVVMPADPRRCDGVSVGGLSSPVALAWEPAPPEPGWLERLMSGPRLVYRPEEAS